MLLPPDIGVPTDSWLDLPLGAALERIAELATLAEIDSEEGHNLLVPGNCQAARESGLRLTVHGPYMGLEPGSTDERVRRRTIDEHRRHLEAAAEVGALRYVVHPDYVEASGQDAAVLAALERSLADLTGLQSELGVPVVVENMENARHSHFTAPGDIDLGELGFALDAGHAAITGNLGAFLRDPKARLQHVHLHDNEGPRGVEDPHNALGTGIVDCAAVLAAARARGATVILELFAEPELHASIAYLRKVELVPS